MTTSSTKYEISYQPYTGDVYGFFPKSPESINFVEDFIRINFDTDYTLLFRDTISGESIEIINHVDEILDDITNIVNEVATCERTYIHSVIMCHRTKNYIVNMDFTRGEFDIPGRYKYEDSRIIKLKY
jgi:hypothetical protein